MNYQNYGGRQAANSMASVGTEESAVDPEEINDKMDSFTQDILELSALKGNIPLFKSVSLVEFIAA